MNRAFIVFNYNKIVYRMMYSIKKQQNAVNVLKRKFERNEISENLMFVKSYYSDERLSKASRIPFPNKLNAKTIMSIATPGKMAR